MFTGAILGVMLADYAFVSERSLEVFELYNTSAYASR